MRIIHYIGSFSFGGIERLVHDLVSQQCKREELVADIGAGSFRGEFKDRFEGLGVRLLNFNLNSGFDLNPYKIYKIYKHFNKFDIIHLHGFHLSVILAALLSNKKLIYTEHGNFGFGRRITLIDKISFWLRKCFFKTSKVIICCNSKFTKQQVVKMFCDNTRVKVVYNGIKRTVEINKELKNKLKKRYDNKFIIGTTGRLAGVKRIDKIIEVFKAFEKNNIDSLMIVLGDGPEKEKLLTKVKEYNLEKKIFFLGYQSQVMTYQSIFDVNILASKGEAFGLVALESYLLKTPILSFKDGGGITEIIDKFSPKDICESIQEMLDRINFYKNNEFIITDDFFEKLNFFSLERMEQDYYNQYKAIY